MRRRHRLAWIGSGAALVLVATGLALAIGGLPGNGGEPSALADRPEPRGDACIHDDAGTMRREHMDLLRAHKDESVREGRRDADKSLQGCVNCHATPAEQQAQGVPEMAFCTSCHEYTAVEMACFQCHSSDDTEGHDER
ncbi:MAG: sulfur reduction protein DsrJ [Halorhodospira halophila]|uniref:sulfur reduction protein DsrJ n=1 Tax=Halorhodospira TaxID=85108 RepID=UPI00191494C5|nr:MULTISPECIES: sulfur reduction protein DsrJ [Halorhodospira]MBK5936555.1 hypothetical protein [Halorhodospira halophila]MBK5944272.1 hypothetical protein [Halorhodospira halophila]MCC3750063.1 sulfur reduction protein DsrJ [Halorhodospira halophila]MCG5527607.1 sulfur reduction protein DsrJ [Halorhodospira halophila]MCG5532626.1 sulfur reduction protein DsrJ [Halorhodospira sp. 9621]